MGIVLGVGVGMMMPVGRDPGQRRDAGRQPEPARDGALEPGGIADRAVGEAAVEHGRRQVLPDLTDEETQDRRPGDLAPSNRSPMDHRSPSRAGTPENLPAVESRCSGDATTEYKRAPTPLQPA